MGEPEKLFEIVGEFSKKMLLKLLEKYYVEDYDGWDDPDEYSGLRDSLKIHLEKTIRIDEKLEDEDGLTHPSEFFADEYIDIANLALFLWRHHRIAEEDK